MATQEDNTATTTNGTTIDAKIDTDHHNHIASDTTSSVPPHHPNNKLPSHLIDTPSKKRPRQDNFQYESDKETDNVNGSNDDDRKSPQQVSPTDLNLHDENKRTAENDDNDDKRQTTTAENGKEESEEKEAKKLRMTTTSSDDGEQQQQQQEEQQAQETQQQQQQPTSSSPLPSDSNEAKIEEKAVQETSTATTTSTTTTTSVKIEEDTSPTLTTATTTTAPNTNTNSNTIPHVSTPLSTPTPPSMMTMTMMNPPTALTPPTTTTTSSSTLPSVPGLTPTLPTPPPSLASTLYSTPMVTPPPPPSQSSQQPLAPGTTTTSSTPAHNNALLYAQQINQHQHHQHNHHNHHQQKQLSSTLTTPTGEVIDTSQMNHLCRVYIGNIHFELSQDDIRRTFSGFGTIVNMMTSKDPITQRHKGFCFIDYSTADSAQAAIDHMNGFQLAGRPLKLGRPKNEGKNAVPGMPILPLYYSPLPPPKLSQQRVREALEVAQSVATQINSQTAAGSANKVYVGSIHWDITEKELMTVFSACGTILSCHLSPNPETGKHRGYGFIEFAMAEQAEEAIRRMNNFELAGRRLKVNRAVPGAASATMQLRQQQVQNVVASGSGVMGAGMGGGMGMGAYQQQQHHPYQAHAAQQYMPQQQQQQQQVPSYYGNAYAQQQMYYQPQQQPQAAYYQAPTAATTTMNIQPPTSSPYSAAAYGTAAAPHYQSYYQQQQQQQQQHSLSAEENFHIKGTSQRYMVMQQMMRQASADESNTPSRCILLNNMVAPGGDKDPQLQNEVTTECSKHGYVEKVVIYALPSAVKIFVLFRDIESAHRAKTALDKRWFGGRLIDAQYYSTEKFNRGQFQ